MNSDDYNSAVLDTIVDQEDNLLIAPEASIMTQWPLVSGRKSGT